MTSILDAGFLYALVDENDTNNSAVVSAMMHYRGKIILPTLAITEAAYLVKRNMGLMALALFAESLADVSYDLMTPLSVDFVRSAEILRKYNDVNIDLVDTLIVAIAERLNITRILTVDRRHFGMFKPKHCEAFELLP